MIKSIFQLNSLKRVFLVDEFMIKKENKIFIKFVLIIEIVWHTVCIIKS